MPEPKIKHGGYCYLVLSSSEVFVDAKVATQLTLLNIEYLLLKDQGILIVANSPVIGNLIS